jgi:hypothetical protein
MKTTLYVQNLKCNYGESIILKALSKLNHIHNIIIKKQFATVTFEHTSPDDINYCKENTLTIRLSAFWRKK